MHGGWIALIVIAGLIVLCELWTLVTAPGFRVRDKHVFISGATKGVGLATAKKYALAGAKLSLVGRSMERLESAKAEIQKAAGDNAAVSIFLAVCDIADPEAVERTIADANAFHGRATDHVVHAAVVVKPGYAWEQSVAQLHKDMGATYLGAVHLFKYALPAMIKGGVHGRFVVVASVGALTTTAGSSSYSGSLFALRGLADTLRNELILYGISMSIYFPGAVRGNPYTARLPAPTFSSDASLPPQTPTEGKSSSVTSYRTFTDEAAPSVADFDAQAKSLVSGLAAGHYSITNSWSGYLMRVLNNGTAPRKNNAVEFLSVLFIAGYHALANAVYARQRVVATAAAPTATGTAV